MCIRDSIIDLVLQPVMIRGPAGCKIGVSDPPAIDPGFIDAVSSNIGVGRFDFFAEAKLFAEKGAWPVGCRLLISRLDPQALPIGCRQ